MNLSCAHPLGIHPLGDMLLTRGANNASRRIGLGHLSRLDDSFIHSELLQTYLDADDIARLACCSKACYAFCTNDELYRALLLGEFGSQWTFQHSWRYTYACTRLTKRHTQTESTASSGAAARISPSSLAPFVPIRCDGLYSDFLFRSWAIANAGVSKQWLKFDNLQRRSADQLSVDEFVRDFEQPNVPLVITDLVTTWPAYAKWTPAHLCEQYGHIPFHAAGFDFSMKSYFDYCFKSTDDQPLYLFDKQFASKASRLAADYQPPPYFDRDLFRHLGATESEAKAATSHGGSDGTDSSDAGVTSSPENTPKPTGADSSCSPSSSSSGDGSPTLRPDYRWLIIGPAKSGSVFHKDPNGTSAWNACISGTKKWILFPPHMTPAGVHPSEDGASVATPLTPMEWFTDFYSHAARQRDKWYREHNVQQHADGSTSGTASNTDNSACSCAEGRPAKRSKVTSSSVSSSVSSGGGGLRPRHVARPAAAGGATAAGCAAPSSTSGSHPPTSRAADVDDTDGTAPWAGPVEGIVRAGEVIFVPRGWWHAVINLEGPSIAITHNYCSEVGLPHVLRFLRDKPYAVSGVSYHRADGLYADFRRVLAAKAPDALAAADAVLAASGAAAAAAGVNGEAASGDDHAAPAAAPTDAPAGPRWRDIVPQQAPLTIDNNATGGATSDSAFNGSSTTATASFSFSFGDLS